MTTAPDPPYKTPTEWWALLSLQLSEQTDWASVALLPVVAAAAAHPQLRLLYPFQSTARLCFSRTSWPHTNDCPCIEVQPAGNEWLVSTPPYPENEQSPALLLVTDRLTEAIDCAARNLPPSADVG